MQQYSTFAHRKLIFCFINGWVGNFQSEICAVTSRNLRFYQARKIAIRPSQVRTQSPTKFCFPFSAQERKVSCMVFWLITTYLICWIPYLVTRILYITPVATSPLIDAIAVLVLHLNIVMNPVLNLIFRKELRSTIERLFRPRGDEVSPMQIFMSDVTTRTLERRNSSKPS